MSSYAFFFTDIYPDIRGSYLNPEGKVDSRAVAKAAGAKWNALSEDDKKVSGIGGRMSSLKRVAGKGLRSYGESSLQEQHYHPPRVLTYTSFSCSLQPYVQKGKSAQEAYKSSYLKYYNSLSATDLARLNSILPRPLLNPNLPRTAADGSKLRHNIRNPKKEGEPQRPIGGFFAFMRELREDEGLKKEAEEKGVSKGDMQVWLSKKGGETWATMNDEQKKVGPNLLRGVSSSPPSWSRLYRTLSPF